MSRGSSRVFAVDRSHPTVPAELQAPPAERGEIVLLLADAATREAGWVGALAIDLAETWGSGEASVILADGDLTTSVLHESVGIPNVEGMSDLVRYGASTDRVARPVGARSFRFIPKGTIVPDPEAVYGERRWSDWFLQVRDAGIVLVLCLPTEFAGVAALTEGADRILVLTGDDVDAPDDERVVVLRGEQVAGAAVPPVAPADSPPAEPAGVEQLFAASAAPAPKGRSRGSESRPGKVFLLAFLVVVLLLIVASWLGLVSIPGLTGSGSTG